MSIEGKDYLSFVSISYILGSGNISSDLKETLEREYKAKTNLIKSCNGNKQETYITDIKNLATKITDLVYSSLQDPNLN